MYFVVAAFMIFAGVSSQNLGVMNNMNINRRAVYPFVAMNQNGNLRNQMSIPFSYVVPSGSQFDDRLEERVLGASFNPTAFQSRNGISENALGASLNTFPRGFFPTYEQALGDSINGRNEQALGASINYLSGYQRFASGLIRPYSPLMNIGAVVPFNHRYQQNEGVLGASTTPFTFSNEAALGASITPYVSINNLQTRMGPFSLPNEGALGDRISFSGQNGWMRQVLRQNMYLRYPEQVLGDSISLPNQLQRDNALGDSLGQDEQVLGSWTWPFFYRGQGYGRRLHGYKRRAKY